MSHSSWDIVIVPFPYSERLAEKRRPAVIVSNGLLHRIGYLWIAMITRTGKDALPGDVMIDDWSGSGLPVPSLVRVAKVVTIEPARVLRDIGRLGDGEQRAVTAALDGFLAR